MNIEGGRKAKGYSGYSEGGRKEQGTDSSSPSQSNRPLEPDGNCK